MLKYPTRLALALIALVMSGTIMAAEPDTTRDIDPLIAALCSKRVVLLGEDSGHGAGATVAMKGRIMRALVERCGFRSVYVEGPVYEFLDLEERLVQRTARVEHLADAVGGMWAGTQEFEPTLRWLWDQANTGLVRVYGLDVQVAGISQHFSERALSGRLAVHAGPARAACEDQLGRLTRWDFPASRPYDAAFREQLRDCLTNIDRALSSSSNDLDLASRRMAISLLRYLDMAEGDTFNVRDAAMAENFMWHHARAPEARAIVWTATSHAVKAPLPSHPDRVSLGMHLHDHLGDALASIGFSAKAGRHGRPGSRPPVSITYADDALEQRNDGASYLDNAHLRRLGSITSSVVAYGRPQRANWGIVLDGIVLLPRETPLHAMETDPPAWSE